MTTFYRVSMNGKYAAQDVVNILWYRDASAFADALAFNGLANALLATVRDSIWADQGPLHVRGYGMRELMPVGYTLDNISVLAYSDAHLLITDTPVILDVNQAGLSEGNTNGPSNYVAMRANLEPSFGPGIGLPKKGYLAIGPIIDNNCDDTGHLTAGGIVVYNRLGDNLATNINTTLPLSVFYPIRVKLVYVAGFLTSLGFKDVDDFNVRPIVKQRRSRLPEA